MNCELTLANFSIGDRVISKKAFADVPKGTHGIVCAQYLGGIVIAWDLPLIPLPDLNPLEIGIMLATDPKCPLRDGFNEQELKFLEKC